MSDVKLRACPFCGERAHIQSDGSSRDEMFYVCCLGPNCHVSLGERYDRDAMPDYEFRDREAAIAAWNARSESPVEKAAGEMYKALEEMLTEKADYMLRNNLGDPTKETVSILARTALAAYDAVTKGENCV